MSALPPKADIGGVISDVLCANSGLMHCSNLGSLLDHVVRDAEQRRRHGEPEHPSG